MLEKKPLILISNDDSIHAKGIAQLIDFVKEMGRIVVVAPDKGHSAQSHAVTMTKPLTYKHIETKDNIKLYSCSGTPADCVKIAVHEILEEKPDLVLSGINHGSNASTSVIYSGTMAAAIEGSLNEIPSIGFSLLDYDANANFEHTKEYVKKLCNDVLKNGLPRRTCLNVNFPKTPDIKGIKVCRQTDGAWAEKFTKGIHPHGFEYFWLAGTFINHEPHSTDTDEWALENNYVSVVPITSDLTNYDFLSELHHRY